MSIFGSSKSKEASAAEQKVAGAVDSNQMAVQALQESNEAIRKAIQQVVEDARTQVKAAVKQTQEDAIKQAALRALEPGEMAKKLRPESRPHCFIVMPFGKKKGGDGSLYDFNAIYQQLIKPAVEMAGFESFRADEATTSGDILTDMFQELLLADMVVCDLSIDNANAFYELGIRHALRKRGVVHIQAGRAYMPFDIFNVRTIPYHITPEGVPDPEHLEKDIASISRITRDTWASDRDAVHSPIFNLLTGLTEPDQKALRTPLATGFWREYNEWKDRVTVAQRNKRIGDILLLTEEITNPLIKEEAVEQAGKALANMGRNELALTQYRKGLEINPHNLNFRRQEAFHLNRSGKVQEAIVKIESILQDYPGDSEATAYLGRIYKEMWVDSWKWVKDDDQKRMRTAFDSYHWLLKAYNTYVRGFRENLNNTYPGINALTLATILVHLADQFDDPEDPDPEIDGIRRNMPELQGALEFALEHQTINDKADYWTLASLAELRVLTSDRTQKVIRAYRKALPASRRTLFYLESSLQQLEMLKMLHMRDEYVNVATRVLNEELSRLYREEYSEHPVGKDKLKPHQHDQGNVFLFAGYLMDRDKEVESCFPASVEQDVRKAINTLLDKLGAGPEDLAVTCGMSAGGDLVFIECCIERGMQVDAYLPVPEAAYVRDYVSPMGEGWVERFYKSRNHPLVDEHYQAERLGAPKAGDDLYERNNRWALYSSLSRGVDKTRLIAVFDDKSSRNLRRDARLVRHMIDLMRDMGGQVDVINPSRFQLPAVAKKAVRKAARAVKTARGKTPTPPAAEN